ncbi:multidrug efflux SMR transporter [Paenibacillus sp. PL2-23]|uniref:DMT family transporter n=1 Tax=Paenibacillus sp. PL2-23 TaxID=2100729 RepID=UPI0030F66F07
MKKQATHANLYWGLVFLSGIFEVGWVAGLKHADSLVSWSLTIAAILLSFAILLYTSQKLPTSTVYAVFVGLGTAGTVFAEMLLYDELFSWAKMSFIGLLLVGIIGLKLVTSSQEETRESKKQRGGERE